MSTIFCPTNKLLAFVNVAEKQRFIFHPQNMRCKYNIVLILSIFSCLYCKQSFFSSCHAQTLDFPARLKQGQQLVDRNQDYLVSENGGFFKLGFLSPGTSSASGATSNRYLGLFYTKLPSHPDAVWVANPKTPISDSSGVFTLDSDGKLKIMYSGGQISVSDTNQTDSGNVTATLLGTGNLVLQEIASNGAFGSVLWESFDHPTNTLLPGMKLGMNFKTGQKWTLFSWLSDQVPAPGAFSLGVDPGGADQLIIWRRGDVYWKSGVWVNDGFQGSPELTKRVDLFEFTFVSNKEEKYFSYSVKNSSTFSRWELNLQGQIQHSVLNPNRTIWESTVTSPCEFNENYPDAMCIEEKISKCRNGSELFVPIRGYFNETKFLYADDDTSLAISDCHAACWRNCTCVGYLSLYTNNGTGCVYMIEGAKFEESDYFGFTYILTIGRNSSKDGTPTEEGKKNGSAGSVAKKWWIWFVISITLSVTVLLLGYLRYIRKIKRRFMQHTSQKQGLNELRSQITRIGNVHRLKLGKSIGQEFQMFSFSGIVAATNNFSSASKLGEGGFGPVYKGVLPDGQQVAVKRLARNSGQGLEELRNEITLIAELQHRNLVRILGCCIQGEEKILIYEYLTNASLDAFLFDSTKGKHLDWQQRVNIIEGIAQGLLYLHKYSRVRIIHRDLKASNILLDGNMNPKISDFGMARIFEQNESTSKTKRIVGTYGYMPPEYAMKGIFSDKSDVYSFGVLLLEIVSGKKNTVFVSSTAGSLVELAWDSWKQGDTQELKDTSLDSCPEDEVLKFIHLSLLCVQEYAADRPTMAEVISMLTSDSMFFPDPKQPAYYISRSEVGPSRPDGRRPDMGSADYVPITVMEAR